MNVLAINEIFVEGFQSHTNSHFNLGKGLNVITGPSDSGKTAIIRAVRWVAFNEPQGEAFVNESVGHAAVAIHLDNGIIISKHRRKGKTSYRIQTDPGDAGSVFEKSEVPEEVKQLLGITKQTFGDFVTALNFAFQLEAPFLISETPSSGAKVLGKLAGTEAVDLAVKSVSKDTYAARQERLLAEKEIERLAGNLLEYLDVDDKVQQLKTAESLMEHVEELHKKKEVLKEISHMYTSRKQKYIVAWEIGKRLEDVPVLIQILEQTEKDQQRLQTLLDLQKRYESLSTAKKTLTETLKQFDGLVEVSNLLQDSTKFEERYSLLFILSQNYKKYSQALQNVQLQLGRLTVVENIDVVVIEEEVKKKDELNKLFVQHSVVKQRYEKTSMDVNRLSVPSGTSDQLQECETSIERLNQMHMLLHRFETTHKQYVNITSRVERLHVPEEAEIKVTEAEKNVSRLVELNELLRNYMIWNQRVRHSTSTLELYDKHIENYKKELEETWNEAGGVCPLCESPMSFEHSH
ncbi:exonuclease SbcC [Bacillus thuringiensis LM1212]|uniref:AAA family ATPase n=1 Tax=Bacillus cereus group TaxID=86661 RepID=UPI0004966ACE|nr:MULTISPECIES: AAA family ATPase [Bacillus cereus group]AXY09988.1 exonuclease SbcC [Bacillus thuringiensis LM1212]QDF22889.1 exonuclease SbcC [Bacillus tropicus]QUG96211.1 AAA family ATPase [Bacillus tropicus]